jgi:hypothetical protein
VIRHSKPTSEHTAGRQHAPLDVKTRRRRFKLGLATPTEPRPRDARSAGGPRPQIAAPDARTH